MIKHQLLGDIDIDTNSRERLLEAVDHVSASVIKAGRLTKHNTGVYFHHVPQDPFSGWCSINYQQAESEGCYKVDVLNNSIYNHVRDEQHLTQLMETPPMWSLLQHQEVVQELAHINQHWELVSRLKPKSVLELAMLLALIRPGKRHLVNKCDRHGWLSISDQIWTPDKDGYTFKKAHAVSLAMTIAIQLNLLVETMSNLC
jgi:hypothetical protein